MERWPEVISTIKRCRTLSGHNVVEGKDFKYGLAMIHDDEYIYTPFAFDIVESYSTLSTTMTT